MRILVVNSGSSSLKLDWIETPGGARHAARVERLGTAEATLRVDAGAPQPISAPDAEGALAAALPALQAAIGDAGIDAVGHRVVHGGEEFVRATPVDDAVLARIEALSPLAPLHNPPALALLRAARAALPDLPHLAVFDTAFHATLPRRARHYALPQALAEDAGLRRYGFHGTSHAWVARQVGEHLGEDPRALRIVSLHLGSGCSATAIEAGRSVETSMGLTPLEGLVMGTRSGDVDPGALIALLRRDGVDVDGLETLLNRESGLAGLSGVGSDLRDIEARAAEGDAACQLALHVFCHRARKYVGAYAAVMGGMDVLAFTGGIGQNSALVRHSVASRLEFLGARLDEARNREARVDRSEPVAELSQPHSRVRILAVAADEAMAIAQECRLALAEGAGDARELPIAISARHVHLTQEAVNALFGAGHVLEPSKNLSQPGQFAAKERVTLVGPKSRLENVRVVGPTRGHCQVEISRTDEFQLGIDAPIRCSGDIEGTPGLLIEGPAGEWVLEEGVICAQRHIHMTPDDAVAFGVGHKDLVDVAVDGDGRDLVFRDVVVRVKDSYRLEMHVDTDEGNAAELARDSEAVLVETEALARIVRTPGHGE